MKMTHSEQRSLKFRDLSGSFLTLALGLALSTIAFTGELISRWLTKK